MEDGTSPAPIDRAVLQQMRSRFLGSRQIDAARILEDEKLHLRVELSSDYYPSHASARFEIRWYRNDGFNIYYQEQRDGETWQYRWDRHPNVHNSRDHFHLPPVASRTEAQDAEWPNDHREVCRLVLDYLEERIETLWE
ncbi:conserved hypothetical protein [Halorhabdus tiamatea SARL4B]|uniref:Uncharacterized protein n=1 Tax=Halorhabdus tiamatea SARL4B TaxID=1033806 RepID=F7PGR6_9EURY|nr:hypothetical protein [Halorhabdus tiamatea]CCQ33888.1 conserved hypothetical protein [Halorhabdus tiamatea SARL4B]